MMKEWADLCRLSVIVGQHTAKMLPADHPAYVSTDVWLGRDQVIAKALLEALQVPLPLAGRLVRVFGAVIEIPMLAVLHTRENLPLRRAVAFQLVGDDHPGHVLAPFQQLAEERLRRFLVPPALDYEVEDIRVNLDLWYAEPPTKGGHRHGHITVRRSPDPPYGGLGFDQSHRG